MINRRTLLGLFTGLTILNLVKSKPKKQQEVAIPMPPGEYLIYNFMDTENKFKFGDTVYMKNGELTITPEDYSIQYGKVIYKDTLGYCTITTERLDQNTGYAI